MTDLLGGAAQSEIWIEQDCKRAVSAWYLRPYYVTELWPIPDAPVGSRRNSHWPGGAALLGDSGDVGMLYDVKYTEPDLTRGVTQQFAIAGTTRDVYGQPLPFVTVKLYQTATDLVQSSIVSDGNGNFLLTTALYGQSHYLVFYKAGTPDIFATSKNTLLPE